MEKWLYFIEHIKQKYVHAEKKIWSENLSFVRRSSSFGVFYVKYYIGKEIYWIGWVFPNNPTALRHGDALWYVKWFCIAPWKKLLEVSASQGPGGYMAPERPGSIDRGMSQSELF